MNDFEGIKCREHPWWNIDKRRWQDEPKAGCQNYYPCWTLRAFKRHLRHYGVKGVRYTLVSRYIGDDVSVVCKKNGKKISRNNK